MPTATKNLTELSKCGWRILQSIVPFISSSLPFRPVLSYPLMSHPCPALSIHPMSSGFHLTIWMRHWWAAEVDGDRKWYSAVLAIILVGSNFRSYFFFYIKNVVIPLKRKVPACEGEQCVPWDWCALSDWDSCFWAKWGYPPGGFGWKWNGVDSLHIVLAFVQSRSTWRTFFVSKGQRGQKFSAIMCMWCGWLLVGRRLWAQSLRKYLSLLRVGVASEGLDSLEMKGLVHLQWLWLPVHMQILWWIFLKG